MAEKSPQNFANHARFDPLFHFFVAPVVLVTWVILIVLLVRSPGWLAGWKVVVATALVVAVFKIRLYALRVQDRIIRLEERLRLGALLPEAQIAQLSEDQLIGLRFASEAEVPALAARTLSEKLSRKDIKKAIQNWRPDYWRV